MIGGFGFRISDWGRRLQTPHRVEAGRVRECPRTLLCRHPGPLAAGLGAVTAKRAIGRLDRYCAAKLGRVAEPCWASSSKRSEVGNGCIVSVSNRLAELVAKNK